MMKRIFLIIIAISAFALGMVFFQNTADNEISYVVINGQKIFVEVADSPEERSHGLMYRTNMPMDQGMLFIFDEESERSFWMKNTLIPLDIIFIDSDYTIVNIENAIPCEEDPCELYSSEKPAKYVIEVIGGYTENYGISKGDKVEIY